MDVASRATKADLAHVENALKADLAQVEKPIEQAIAEVKVDLFKWVIGLMITQTGLVFAMLRATR